MVYSVMEYILEEYAVMDLTSFYFLCFFAVLLAVYYITPGRLQWMILLGAGIIFYLCAGEPLLILYPLAAVAVSFLCAGGIVRAQESGDQKKAKRFLLADLLLLIGCLAVVKYLRFGSFNIAVPIGLSFYTFTLVGYTVDLYNGIGRQQKNPLKLLTYGMYFPLMISGPILKYREDGEQFFERHRISYDNLTLGAQRILWGFFKKLVIAERAAVLSTAIFDHYDEYSGAYIWFGALMFTFQLYTDFSGCMDIVLGISQMLGIRLPENFRSPFFSKNISEYWRRWHITLGIWMREYVFYPLLRSGLFTKIGKSFREKFGKKRGKQLTTFLAMAVLWFTVGLWHGGNVKYLIGSGMLHWFYIVMGELTLPFFKKVLPAAHIPMEGKAADAFRILRTFFLVNIGNVFFNAASAGDGFRMLVRGVSAFNPWILLDGSLLKLGLDSVDCGVLALSLILLLIVSLLQEKGSVRDRIAALPLPLRWVIWMAFLFLVILMGQYGPGYISSEFIYADF